MKSTRGVFIMLKFVRFIHFCGLIGIAKGIVFIILGDVTTLFNYKYSYAVAGYFISLTLLIGYCWLNRNILKGLSKQQLLSCRYAVSLNVFLLAIYAYKTSNTIIFCFIWLLSFLYYTNRYSDEKWRDNCKIITNAILIVFDYFLMFATDLLRKINTYRKKIAIIALVALCLGFVALTINLDKTDVVTGNISSGDSSTKELVKNDTERHTLDVDIYAEFRIDGDINNRPIIQTSDNAGEGINVALVEDNKSANNDETGNKFAIYLTSPGEASQTISANLDKAYSYKCRAKITDSRRFEFYLDDLKLYESYFMGENPEINLLDTINSLKKNKEIRNWRVNYSFATVDLKEKLNAFWNTTAYALIMIALFVLFAVAAVTFVWDEGRKCLKFVFPLLVFTTIFSYNLLFANSYFPVGMDWFQNYAWLMHTGSFPYRDFYLILPPGFVLLTYVLQIVFGHLIWWFHFFAITMFAGAAVVQYFIYRHLFDDKVALFCAVVSMIFYESEITLTHFDFIHPCIFLGYLALLLAIIGLRKNTGWLTEMAVGMICAMSFMFKQSIGLFILLMFAALYICFAFKQKLTRKAVAFFVGGFIIIVGVVLWLSSNDAFYPFIQQSFIGASGAKGGIVTMLTGWFDRSKPKGVLIGILITVILLNRIYPVEERYENFIKIKSNSSAFSQMIIFFSLMVVVIVPYFGQELFFEITEHYRSYLRDFIASSNNDVTVIGAAALIYYLYSYVRGEKKRFELLIVGFVVACGIGWGLSASIASYGTALGLGLIIGIFIMKSKLSSGEYVSNKVTLIRGKRIAVRVHKILTISMVIGFFVVSMLYVSEKYHRPYSWWGFVEASIWESAKSNTLPELSGIRFNQHNSLVYGEIISYIKNNSLSSDSLYCYPNLPIFNVLASRRNPCFSQVDWFDFCPDNEARESLELIKNKPPKFILFLDFPEFVYKGHEDMFRQGKKSGQREIKDYIEKSIGDGQMLVVKRKLISSSYILYLLKPISAGQ